MKPKHTLHHFLALAGTSLLAVSSAHSATINVNILRSGGSPGTTTNPGYGLWGEGANTWNLVLGNVFTVTNLVDSTGTPTTVGYTLAGTSGTNNPTNWGPDLMTQSGAFSADDNTTVITLTLNQLTPGQAYEILYYFSDVFPNETMTAQGAGPSVFMESKTTTGLNTYVEGSAGSGVFSYFDNVIADVGGNIVVAASGAGRETITGFQLRVIPEPSTALLSGLGLLALLRRRR